MNLLSWDKENVARVFRWARKHHGLNQRKMGRLLGMKQSQVSRIEARAVTPNLEQVIRFSQSFQVELSEVIQGLVDKGSPSVREPKASYGAFEVPDKYATDAAVKMRMVLPPLRILGATRSARIITESFRSMNLDPDLTVNADYQFNYRFLLDVLSFAVHSGVDAATIRKEMDLATKEILDIGRIRLFFEYLNFSFSEIGDVLEQAAKFCNAGVTIRPASAPTESKPFRFRLVREPIYHSIYEKYRHLNNLPCVILSSFMKEAVSRNKVFSAIKLTEHECGLVKNHKDGCDFEIVARTK